MKSVTISIYLHLRYLSVRQASNNVILCASHPFKLKPSLILEQSTFLYDMFFLLRFTHVIKQNLVVSFVECRF